MTRRMFDSDITETDLYDLSIAAQALYFHIGMRADDDGLIGSLKPMLRQMEINPDALQELIDNGYIIRLGKVFAVTHWFRNNHLRGDTYHPTYRQEIGYLDTPPSTKQRVGWIYRIKPKYVGTLCQDVDDYFPENPPVTDTLRSRNEPVTDALRTRHTVSKISKYSIGSEKSRNSKEGSQGDSQSDSYYHQGNEGLEPEPIAEENRTATSDKIVGEMDSGKETPPYHSPSEAAELAEQYLNRPLQRQEKIIIAALCVTFQEKYYDVLADELNYFKDHPEHKPTELTLNGLCNLFSGDDDYGRFESLVLRADNTAGQFTGHHDAQSAPQSVPQSSGQLEP